MGILGWVSVHGLDVLQSAGIIGGLLFTAYNVRADSRERKIQSVYALTDAHRDIWSMIYQYPHLARVLDDAEWNPLSVSTNEEMFVNFLILHLSASFRARKLGMNLEEEGLRLDVREFFSLPIPKVVWDKSKPYQDSDFVAFVESNLNR